MNVAPNGARPAATNKSVLHSANSRPQTTSNLPLQSVVNRVPQAIRAMTKTANRVAVVAVAAAADEVVVVAKANGPTA
jgi:hypothetical protein